MNGLVGFKFPLLLRESRSQGIWTKGTRDEILACKGYVEE